MTQALIILLGTIVLVIVVMLNTVFTMWLERKVLGHLQGRLGPMRTGFHGLMQPFADALKILGKEDIVPAGADRVLFLVAPIIAFTPSILVYAATPWVANYAGLSLDVGIFFIFAVAALFPVGILVGGWASRNKYSLIGGFRAASQQISYEVPMILSVMGLVMLAGSMKISEIVGWQSSQIWNIVTQPFAFALYFIGLLAELNRTPFDMPEAESELIGGFNTEYSSMRFALFFVAEYANTFTWSLITVLLFFGGWTGTGLLGFVTLLLKTYFVVFLIIWVRATIPRIRVDQLMALGWKLLLPASLINVLLTAIGIVTNTWVLIGLQVIALVILWQIIARLGLFAGEDERVAANELLREQAAEMNRASKEVAA